MKMKNLISVILLLLTVALNAMAGGVYTRVDTYTEIEENDVIIIASHSRISEEDKVVLMTATVSSGKISSVVYGDYTDDTMPATITLDDVNQEGFPYEYTIGIKSMHVGYNKLNINLGDNLLGVTRDATNSLDINTKSSLKISSTDASYWQTSENTGNLLLLDIKGRSLKCESSADNIENCFFSNNNGTVRNPYNFAYFYKKTGDLPENVDFTIGSVGYATLYYGEKDVTMPEGMTAYTYGLSENKLSVTHTFSKGDVIPAGTAVVVKGNPGTNTLTLNTPSAAPFGGNNILQGSDTEEMTEGEGKFYVLSVGSNGLGFYYGAEDGVAFPSAAHKAYLCISSAQSAKTIHFALPDDEEITSVGRVGEASPFDTRVYDLSGRRVSQPARGIYLRNRKAYMVNP